MKRSMIIVLIMMMCVSFVFAQNNGDSKLDAGLRLGIMNTAGGVSARYALSENTRVEAIILTPGFNGTIYTGLFQLAIPFGKVENLKWYVGGGLHMGYWAAAPAFWTGTSWVSRKFALGIDAVAGVEYNMADMVSFPLIIGLDYKPGWDFLTTWADQWGNVSLSLRYAF